MADCEILCNNIPNLENCENPLQTTSQEFGSHTECPSSTSSNISSSGSTADSGIAACSPSSEVSPAASSDAPFLSSIPRFSSEEENLLEPTLLQVSPSSEQRSQHDVKSTSYIKVPATSGGLTIVGENSHFVTDQLDIPNPVVCSGDSESLFKDSITCAAFQAADWNIQLPDARSEGVRNCDMGQNSDVIIPKLEMDLPVGSMPDINFAFDPIAHLSQKQEILQDELPILDLDMESIINVPASEEYRQKSDNSTSEVSKVFDSGNILSDILSTANLPLPGFHQAFGSTEIGRYLQEKDFTQPEIPSTEYISAISLPQQIKSQYQQYTFLSTTHNPQVPSSFPLYTNAKTTKSRGSNKRTKTTDPKPNVWSPYDQPETQTSTAASGSYYKRKESRRGKGYNATNNEVTPQNNVWNCYQSRATECYSSGVYSCPDSGCEYYHGNCMGYSQGCTGNNSYPAGSYRDQYMQQRSSPSCCSGSQRWRNERYFPYSDYTPYQCRQVYNGHSSCMFPQQQPQITPSNSTIQSQQFQDSFNGSYGYNNYSSLSGYSNYY